MSYTFLLLQVTDESPFCELKLNSIDCSYDIHLQFLLYIFMFLVAFIVISKQFGKSKISAKQFGKIKI